MGRPTLFFLGIIFCSYLCMVCEAGASQAERCFPSRCHLLGNPRYLKRSFVAKHRPVEACVVAAPRPPGAGRPRKDVTKKKIASRRLTPPTYPK